MYYNYYAKNVYSWVMYALIIPLLLVRVYVQLRFRARPKREILTILAFLFYTTNRIGSHLIFASTQRYMDTQRLADIQSANLKKGGFLTVLGYLPTIYLCKLLLLVFFLDLTNRRRLPKTWWAIIIAMVVCVFGTFYAIIYAFVQCRPLFYGWNTEGSCFPGLEDYQIEYAVHLFAELLVYCIPFVIIRNTTLTRSEKRGAYFMFSLGTINLICTIVLSIAGLMPYTVDWVIAFNDSVTPLMLQSSLIIVCLPQLRRFWLGMSEEKMKAQREAREEVYLKKHRKGDQSPETPPSPREPDFGRVNTPGANINRTAGVDESVGRTPTTPNPAMLAYSSKCVPIGEHYLDLEAQTRKGSLTPEVAR